MNSSLTRILSLTLLLSNGSAGFTVDGDKPPNSLTEITRLPARLDLQDNPPVGWTHRVFFMNPKLATGEVDFIPEQDREGIRFGTAVLTEVAHDEISGSYALRKVGLGLFFPIEGRRTVVTMGTRLEQKVGITNAAKFALYGSEQIVHQSRLLASSPTFALIALPATRLVEGKHQKVAIRLAIAVEPSSGRVRTAFWFAGRDGGDAAGGASAVILPQDAEFESPTDINVLRAMGVIPKGVVIAMRASPAGTPLVLPSDRGDLLTLASYDATTTAAMASAIREPSSPPERPGSIVNDGAGSPPPTTVIDTAGPSASIGGMSPAIQGGLGTLGILVASATFYVLWRRFFARVRAAKSL